MAATNAQLQSSPVKFWWRHAYVRIITFVLVYLLAIYIGLDYVTDPEGYSVIWPASGVALAALLLSPRRQWRLILAAIFVINLFSNLLFGVSLPVSAGFAFVNTLEPALAGWLIVWLRKGRVTFTRLADVLALTLAATVVNALTALMGALVPTFAFGSPFRDTWLSWWILDGLSMVAVTPFIVTWARAETLSQGKVTPKIIFETIIWMVLLCAATWFMFGMSGVDIYVEQRPYMLYPILVWGALRFSPRASSTALVLTGIIALAGTMAGTGTYPLGGQTSREYLIGVQGFFMVACITILLLSSTIAERTEVTRTLADRNLFVESLINTSPDILYIYDIVERKNVYSNDGIQRILGYTTTEIQDMGEQLIPSLMHPEDFEVYLNEIFPRYMHTDDGELITHQYRMKHKNGKWRILESDEFIYLRNPDGSPRQIFGAIRDITERKQAEAELLETRQRLEDVVNAAPYGAHTYELHSDGKLVFIGANRSADVILGVEHSQFIGKTIEEAFPALTQTEIPTAYRHVASTGEPYYQEQIEYDEQGIVGAYEVHGLQISPNKMTAFFRDVTERKKAEAEQERLFDELERKNKELESLVYVASHDLRSPLVNIQGFSQNLKKYLEQITELLQNAKSLEEFRALAQPILKERTPKAFHFIESSSDKMDALIGGLLRISRVGSVVLQIKPVDMEQMLQEILDTMAYQIKEAGAWIKLESPLATCQGDQNQLNQVFSNLLDNALKYRDSGRPLTITISSKVEAQMVIYIISDTGLGIQPVDQNRIWELFRRLDVDETVPGEGLGLTLARRIVERHGGRLRVESEPGVGSRFYVELPTVT